MGNKKTLYKNWNDVNAAFHELATYEYQKQRLETEKNRQVNSVEQVYSEQLQSIADEISIITKNIFDFIEENKTEFDKIKTKKLPNGTISSRLSTKLEILDEAKTFEAIKRLNLLQCIKHTETLNKDVIKTLDTKTLKKVKADLVTEQKFSIKTNGSEIKTVNNE